MNNGFGIHPILTGTVFHRPIDLPFSGCVGDLSGGATGESIDQSHHQNDDQN
jgi:hypothetical protein